MQPGKSEQGWGGKEANRFLIQEGLEDIELGRKEMEERREAVDQIFLLEKEIADEIYQEGYVSQEIFREVEDMFFLARSHLSERRVVELIQPLYTLFDEEKEYEGEENEGEENFLNSLRNFERIYEITGIPPADTFVTYNLDSGEDINNVFYFPARFVFFRYKDDPEMLASYQQDGISGSAERNRRSAHDVIFEDHTQKEVEDLYNRMISPDIVEEDMVKQMKIALKLREIFPEIVLNVDRQIAQRLYEKVIESMVTNRSYRYDRYDEVNDSSELMQYLALVRKATGVSLGSCKFDEARVHQWYSKVIPQWIEEFSRDTYNTQAVETLIGSIERVTKVSPDFSSYKDAIQQVVDKKVDGFRDNSDAPARTVSWRTGESAFLEMYRVVERAGRFTGVALDFHPQELSSAAEAGVTRYIDDVVKFMKEQRSFDQQTKAGLDVRVKELGRIAETFAIKIQPSETQTREMFAVVLAYVKENLYSIVSSESDSEKNNTLSDIIEYVNQISGETSVKIAEGDVRDLFDHIIFLATRGYHGEPFMNTISDSMKRLESVLKVKRIFHPGVREEVLPRIVTVGKPSFSWETAQGKLEDIFGSVTNADTQLIYAYLFKTLGLGDAVKHAYAYQTKTGFRVSEKNLLPLLLHDPSVVRRIRSIIRQGGKGKQILSQDEKRLIKKLLDKAEKNLWFQAIMDLHEKFSQRWDPIKYVLTDLLSKNEISFQDSGTIEMVKKFFDDFGSVSNPALFLLYKKQYTSDDVHTGETEAVEYIVKHCDDPGREGWRVLSILARKFHCVSNEQVRDAAMRKLKDKLQYDGSDVEEFVHAFDIPPAELQKDPVIQEKAVDRAVNFFRRRNDDGAQRTIACFGVSEEAIHERSEQLLLEEYGGLNNYDRDKAIAIYKRLAGFSLENVREERSKQFAMNAFRKNVLTLNVRAAKEIARDFSLPQEEITPIIEEKLMSVIGGGGRDIYMALLLAGEFAMTNFFSQAEIRTQMGKHFQVALSSEAGNFLSWAQEIRLASKLSDQETLDLSQTVVIACFKEKRIEKAFQVIDKFAPALKSLFLENGPQRDLFVESVKEGLLKNGVFSSDFSLLDRLQKECNLPEEDVAGMVQRSVVGRIEGNDYQQAVQLKNLWKLPITRFAGEQERIIAVIRSMLGKEYTLDQAWILAKEFILDIFKYEDVTKQFVGRIRERLLKDPRSLEKWVEECQGTPFFKKLEEDAWCKNFIRLRSVQAINQKEQNDPWKQEFQPLLAWLLREKIITEESDADSELVYHFIREFGMVDLPEMFSVYAACNRAESWDDFPEEVSNKLEEYGIRLRKKDKAQTMRFSQPKAIVNELRRSMESFQRDLLSDRVPRNMVSALGKEQFKRLAGSTKWTRSFSLEGLLTEWEATVEKDPRIGMVPSGYEEAYFDVDSMKPAERERALAAKEDQTPEQKLHDFFGTREMEEQYLPLAQSLKRAVTLESDSQYWLDNQRKLLTSLESSVSELEKLLEMSLEDFDRMLETQEGTTNKEALRKKRRALSSENGRKGLQKQLDALQDAHSKAQRIHFGFANEQEIIEAMEILAELPGSSSEVTTMLRDVSSVHVLRVAPQGWKTAVREQFGVDLAPTLDRIRSLADLSDQYIKEHYLQKEQVPEHTGHESFSKRLRSALERAWQQQESAKGKTPIGQLRSKMDKMVDPQGEISEKKVNITMVPVSGLLHLYSGYIGNSCHTAQQERMAKGEFPRLRSWIFVTDRGTNKETLRGSLLGVEATERETGIPVLVARANNPQENFIQSISPDQFVVESLLQTIATARRMRAERLKPDQESSTDTNARRQQVVIPLDRSGQSSTNRQPVNNAYRRRWKDCPKVGLDNNPNTNFNGYNIWSEEGSHPCGKIWEIDEQGNEIWHGDWLHAGMSAGQLKGTFRYYIDTKLNINAEAVKVFLSAMVLDTSNVTDLISLAQEGEDTTQDIEVMADEWRMIKEHLKSLT